MNKKAISAGWMMVCFAAVVFAADQQEGEAEKTNTAVEKKALQIAYVTGQQLAATLPRALPGMMRSELKCSKPEPGKPLTNSYARAVYEEQSGVLIELRIEYVGVEIPEDIKTREAWLFNDMDRLENGILEKTGEFRGGRSYMYFDVNEKKGRRYFLITPRFLVKGMIFGDTMDKLNQTLEKMDIAKIKALAYQPK